MMSISQTDVDMESFLTSESSDVEVQSRPKRRLAFVSVFGAAAIAAVVVVARQNHEKSQTDISASIGFDEVQSACFKKGMFYTGPVKLSGTEKTTELSALDCQTRCAQTSGCEHFTFWPDGGCLLTGTQSMLKAAGFKYSESVVGPKVCDMEVPIGISCTANYNTKVGENLCCYQPGVLEDLKNACPSAAPLCVGYEMNRRYGVCVPVPTAPPLKEEGIPALPVVTTIAPTGTNGTTCESYPACTAAGLAGECCPNGDGVALSCCSGFPPVAVQLAVVVGTECKAFPGCVRLNITEGGCCPTPDGARLGCCDEA